MKIYLVGGAVRNELMNLPILEKDWVVVGGTPKEMLAEQYKPVGKDFPVFLHPETNEEYALARTERKISKGYKGFEFYTDERVSLEQDLLRRDLTINAMAKDEKGNIIDPYGGKKDIQKKILRHVSPAFTEDPVRILRVARFYAEFSYLGFTIAPETIKLMRIMVKNGETEALVKERVWQELLKALTTQSPEKFIEALRLCGLLQDLMPELDALFGVPNKIEYHPEIDSGIHTLMVLQQAAKLSDDPRVRFAALLHDLGKALTLKSEWPSHKGHEKAGNSAIKTFCMRFSVPKQFMSLALLTGEFHGLVHKAFELTPKTILNLFEKTNAFRDPNKFKLFLKASEADSRGRPGYENINFTQADYLKNALQAARSVDIKEMVKAGLTGEGLINNIRKTRINAIKLVKIRHCNL